MSAVGGFLIVRRGVPVTGALRPCTSSHDPQVSMGLGFKVSDSGLRISSSSPPLVDRFWLWVYSNMIPMYPIFDLLKGHYSSWAFPTSRVARSPGTLVLISSSSQPMPGLRLDFGEGNF